MENETETKINEGKLGVQCNGCEKIIWKGELAVIDSNNMIFHSIYCMIHNYGESNENWMTYVRRLRTHEENRTYEDYGVNFVGDLNEFTAEDHGIVMKAIREISPSRFFHTCSRCGHTWITKNEHPKVCPNRKCHSPYWDRAREKKGD
jgi:hypothetical protein